MSNAVSESGFTILVFNPKDKKWWAKWSKNLVTIEAPLRSQVEEKIASEYGSPLEEWNIGQLASGGWKAIRKTRAPKN